MSTADRDRWDARYADRTEPIEPKQPDALARGDVLELLPTSGHALDVACGRGAQTMWLAQRGLDVTSLDASPLAVRALVERAALDDLPARRIDARVHDLDGGLPAGLGEFDVIVCQRFRAPHLYESFISNLRPGGMLVMTILSESGAADPGEFHAPPGELTLFFDRPGCTLIAHDEGHGEESIVIRRTSSTTRT